MPLKVTPHRRPYSAAHDLGALLIGPRRGDRAAQSLLLALHRDPTARPEDVVGAVDRIAFLQSRRHAATGALPNVAAA